MEIASLSRDITKFFCSDLLDHFHHRMLPGPTTDNLSEDSTDAGSDSGSEEPGADLEELYGAR